MNYVSFKYINNDINNFIFLIKKTAFFVLYIEYIYDVFFAFIFFFVLVLNLK